MERRKEKANLVEQKQMTRPSTQMLTLYATTAKRLVIRRLIAGLKAEERKVKVQGAKRARKLRLPL